jgi:hypothetical protein
MKFSLFFLLFIGLIDKGYSQDKQYQVAAIGFYNFENLFDTYDDPKINDEEFLPEGLRVWTKERYEEKLKNLARVISELGTELTPDGVAILGVAEIENRRVLEAFVKQKVVADRNYEIVHYDSPDFRGIDVALLYQPKYFKVSGSRPIPVVIYAENGERIFTRDILYVSGELNGEKVHILVNHWPSRRSGEKATRPLRNAAAMICKNVKDSLVSIDPAAKVIVMGDLNDDPVSPSIKDVLACKNSVEKTEEGDFFNPWFEFYKNGIGTMAYQDAWSLFDQIILSAGLVEGAGNTYRFYKAVVHNKPYLIQKTGQFKGYPFRTFDFDNYIAGYSDHFPVYVFLIRELGQK